MKNFVRRILRRIFVLQLACISLASYGCSSGLPSPSKIVSYRDVAKGGYTTALAALQAAAIVRAGFNPSTEAEVLVAEKVDLALSNASDVLDKAGPWIETGKGEAEGKKALKEGLKSILQAVDGLKEVGLDVGKKQIDAVKLALVVLG